MPVFNTAANTQRLPTPWEQNAIKAASRVNEVNAALGEKRLETYDEDRAIQLEMDQREQARKEVDSLTKAESAATARSKLQYDIGKDNVEIIDDAFASGQAAYRTTLDNGGTEKEASSKAIEVSVEKMASAADMETDQARQALMSNLDPEGTWDEVGVNAWLQTSESYRKSQELTADEKFINNLDVSEEVKSQLRLAIAKKKGTITGTTEFDPRPEDPRSKAQKGKAYQVNLDKWTQTTGLQEMISSGLPRVLETPQAVGITGKIATTGAGFLTALGQEDLADQFAEYMSEASPEEISQLQTQLQAIRGQLIPIVTGQESSARLSDKEQKIGSDAVAIIDNISGPADLTKAYPQVVGALKQLYEEGWAKKYLIASQDPGFNYPYDLNDRDQRIELTQEAIDAGLDDESIKRMLTRLRAIQK